MFQTESQFNAEESSTQDATGEDESSVLSYSANDSTANIVTMQDEQSQVDVPENLDFNDERRTLSIEDISKTESQFNTVESMTPGSNMEEDSHVYSPTNSTEPERKSRIFSWLPSWESQSNTPFNIRFVDIITENGAHFQARFPDVSYTEQTEFVTPILFFPSSAYTPQIQSITCPSFTEEDREGHLLSCPSNRMLATSIGGTHNFVCDFGCNRVKNFIPEEHGNGFRCFPSIVPQSNVKYCCKDGPAGDIPGCNDQEENNPNTPPSDHHSNTHGSVLSYSANDSTANIVTMQDELSHVDVPKSLNFNEEGENMDSIPLSNGGALNQNDHELTYYRDDSPIDNTKVPISQDMLRDARNYDDDVEYEDELVFSYEPIILTCDHCEDESITLSNNNSAANNSETEIPFNVEESSTLPVTESIAISSNNSAANMSETKIPLNVEESTTLPATESIAISNNNSIEDESQMESKFDDGESTTSRSDIEHDSNPDEYLPQKDPLPDSNNNVEDGIYCIYGNCHSPTADVYPNQMRDITIEDQMPDDGTYCIYGNCNPTPNVNSNQMREISAEHQMPDVQPKQSPNLNIARGESHRSLGQF